MIHPRQDIVSVTDVAAFTWNTSSVILYKGQLSGLRQLLGIESFLKMIKNVFYFALKALFVFKITKFLSWVFDNVEKRLD